MTDLRALTRQFARAGRVERIFVRPGRDEPAIEMSAVEAVPARGLLGDRSAARVPSTSGGGKRQVTLIQAEHLPLIAGWCVGRSIDAALLRRNLVISGLNLVAARSPFADQDLELRLGDEVRLRVTGDCAPCSKMDRALGPGGYNALRGHGGVTARIVAGGTIRVGDAVVVAPATL